MKKYFNLLRLFLLSLIISICSCTKEYIIQDNNTVYGSGEVKSHSLSLESFSAIKLTGQANIKVTKGDTQTITVRVQDNIFEIMDIYVANGKLNIGLKNNTSIYTSKGIYIDIVTPNSISDVSIVGAGELNISGSSQTYFNINITGAGSVNAYGIDVENSSINISGAAACYVKVSKTLSVNISGTGFVSYKGSPIISQSIAGIGSVINDN